MIPPLQNIVRSCTFLAERQAWEISARNVRLLESLTEAHQLVRSFDAEPQDEPAALFYAFARDYHLFGDDVVSLPVLLARNNARHQGLELRASRYDLIDLARSISGRVASYDDVRRWFAERLAPRV